MEADYGDVVPRRDFERLEAQFNVRNTKLSCEFQKLEISMNYQLVQVKTSGKFLKRFICALLGADNFLSPV